MRGYSSRMVRPYRAAAFAAIALATIPGLALAAEPLFSEQWAMSDSVTGIATAWQASQGNGVVVAIVDSGVNLGHADLAPNAWRNPGEVAGNGVDDDGNGYIDDVNGVDLTSPPNDNVPDDENGHGTHVAGIVAAAANGVGVVGVAPGAKIMAVKAMDANGQGTLDGIAKGIQYAVRSGAQIINLSLVSPTTIPSLTAAVNEACAANVLVVASAGNQGTNNDQVPMYPAALPAPCVVSVAATSPSSGRSLASFSNFGRLGVAIAAPGEGIISTAKNGAYEHRNGTSQAAPQVAGVAALMRQLAPSITAADLRAKIIGAAVPGPIAVTSGYLNALTAVRAVGGVANPGLGQSPEIRVVGAWTAKVKGKWVTTTQLSITGTASAVSRVSIEAKRAVIATKPTSGETTVSVAGTSPVKPRKVLITISGRTGAIDTAVARVARASGDKSSGGPVISLPADTVRP